LHTDGKSLILIPDYDLTPPHGTSALIADKTKNKNKKHKNKNKNKNNKENNKKKMFFWALDDAFRIRKGPSEARLPIHNF
jgi:hypothetical protein